MLVPAVVLLALLFAAPPPALDMYVGEYSLIASESADMKKVVDETAADLNFFIRSIARSRLRKTQIAFPIVRITRDNGEFRIAHEAGTDVAHQTLDAPVKAVAPDGSKIVVRLLPGPPLTQTYESGEGVRTNRYVLSPDRSKLTLETHIVSPRLPKPINYKLVYRRK